MVRAALIAMMGLACAGVERLPAQPAAHPQPTGALIDVGGYRVHLNCVGAGRPTVVIVGSGYSFDWSLVQGPVSGFTRVCTYDPSGSAWSDPGPAPTCDGRVLEIHRMLHGAGVDGPVVLVGHSIGAVFSRMYADRYPAEVQGLVLSDHAGVYRMALPPSTPFGGPPAMLSEEQALDKLPAAAQALHRWAASQPHQSSIPFFNRCIGQLDTSKANRPGSLGSRPLVVIGNMTLAASQDYLKAQSRMLALSQHARSMTSATTGHDAPFTDPETIVRAVRQVIDDLRQQPRN